jgi:hypothetical protein
MNDENLVGDIDYVLGYLEAAIRMVYEGLKFEERIGQGPITREMNLSVLEAAMNVLERYHDRRKRSQA